MTKPDWYNSGMPHIWLPYTQMKTAPGPQAAVATAGSRIKLADGRELVDGVASWWTACHGYNHPHLVSSIKKQLEVMPHVMFGGLVHEPALMLAKRLCILTGMSRAFFADSGSVAVEVALKMALQYWLNKGAEGKTRFVCFRDGYHGDTQGAMSVSDPGQSLHKAFKDVIARQLVAEIPSDEEKLEAFESLLAKHHTHIAGVIVEPLVQGAGGMRFHSPETLAAMYRMAKKYDILFIADEIAVGFGRTGTMFACEQAGIRPDILCLGKALTGGMITLGATLTQEEIFNAFLSDDADAAFMHGPTFMANPLACAAANASLDLFEKEPRLKQIAAIEKQLDAQLEACKKLAHVADVRVMGAIGVVQLADYIDVHALRPKFLERGVWVRPFSDIVYLMPAFTISPQELETLTRSLCEVIAEI